MFQAVLFLAIGHHICFLLLHLFFLPHHHIAMWNISNKIMTHHISSFAMRISIPQCDSDETASPTFSQHCFIQNYIRWRGNYILCGHFNVDGAREQISIIIFNLVFPFLLWKHIWRQRNKQIKCLNASVSILDLPATYRVGFLVFN